MEKNEIFNWISRKSEKIRYKIAISILKRLTPVLYKKLGIKEWLFDIIWSDVPRPSIKIMKKEFNQKQIIGAEIGVRKGLNARSILKELNIKKLYLIDVWDNYNGGDGIWSNMEEIYESILNEFGKDERVQIIKDLSENAVRLIDDKSLDFVYIDGNHSYDYVLQDIELWTPKIKKYGFIAGHDFELDSDVSKAVSKFCSENNIKFQIEIPDWYFIKDGGLN